MMQDSNEDFDVQLRRDFSHEDSEKPKALIDKSAYAKLHRSTSSSVDRQYVDTLRGKYEHIFSTSNTSELPRPKSDSSNAQGLKPTPPPRRLKSWPKDENYNVLSQDSSVRTDNSDSSDLEDRMVVVRQSSEESIDKITQELSNFTMDKTSKDEKQGIGFKRLFSRKFFGKDKTKNKDKDKTKVSATDITTNENNKQNELRAYSTQKNETANVISVQRELPPERIEELEQDYAVKHMSKFQQIRQSFAEEKFARSNVVKDFDRKPTIADYLTKSLNNQNSPNNSDIIKSTPTEKHNDQNFVWIKTSNDTPPRAQETYFIYPNPEKLFSESQSRGIDNEERTIERNLNRTDNKEYPHSKLSSAADSHPVLDETYGTVFDALAPVHQKNVQQIDSLQRNSVAYNSNKSLESSKLRLPPNRMVYSTQPRVTSPISPKMISTDKIIATELLRNSNLDSSLEKQVSHLDELSRLTQSEITRGYPGKIQVTTPKHQSMEKFEIPGGPKSKQIADEQRQKPLASSGSSQRSIFNNYANLGSAFDIPHKYPDEVQKIKPNENGYDRVRNGPKNNEGTLESHGSKEISEMQRQRLLEASANIQRSNVSSSSLESAFARQTDTPPSEYPRNFTPISITHDSPRKLEILDIQRSREIANIHHQMSLPTSSNSQISTMSNPSMTSISERQTETPSSEYSGNVTPSSVKYGSMQKLEAPVSNITANIQQEKLLSTPVNLRRSNLNNSPRKEDIRRSIEEFYWKELKKMKEQEDYNCYVGMQVSNGCTDADLNRMRRSRSSSPSLQNVGRRSLSLPRDASDAQKRYADDPRKMPPASIPEDRALRLDETSSMIVENPYQNFTRGNLERRSVGNVANNREYQRRPIFRRGSLNYQEMQKANIVQQNKKVSFSGGSNVPPQPLTERSVRLEDQQRAYYGNSVTDSMRRDQNISSRIPRYAESRQMQSPPVMYGNQMRSNSNVSNYGISVEQQAFLNSLRSNQSQKPPAPEPIQSLSQKNSYQTQAWVNSGRPDNNNTYNQNAIYQNRRLQEQKSLEYDRVRYPIQRNIPTMNSVQSSSGQNLAAEPVYAQKQIRVSNKYCDIYGQIHDTPRTGVLMGQLQTSPLDPINKQNAFSRQSYSQPPDSPFVRNSRVSSSANDIGRRYGVAKSNYYNEGVGPNISRYQDTPANYDTRPLPPIPPKRKS